MSDLVSFLEFAAGKPMLILCQPEIWDYTSDKQVKLLLNVDGKTAKVPIPTDKIALKHLLGALYHYLGRTKCVVLGWGIKNFFSYVLNLTEKPFVFEGTVIDLKIAESFAGQQNDPPTTVDEALERLQKLSNFDRLMQLWGPLYRPLISKVIPAIEATPLSDNCTRKLVHCYYEIEGQVNGRMKSVPSALKHSYNPHSLSADNKKCLHAPDYEDIFLYFDFKHMEVSVLQWLSKDKDLGEILESGQDIYEGIWERLTGIKSTPEFRGKCKDIFLPVVFGQGVSSLAQSAKMTENIAKQLKDRIYSCFPKALDWVSGQSLDDNFFATDFFGRKRQFLEKAYRIRNFAIQSPASIICLHKLVELHQSLGNLGKICFHLHDGYCILTNRQNKKRVINLGTNILESTSELYPNLKLKTAYYQGTDLSLLESNSN